MKSPAISKHTTAADRAEPVLHECGPEAARTGLYELKDWLET